MKTQALLGEIKEELNKWSDTLCSSIWRPNVFKIPVLPKLISRFMVISGKIPARFSVDIDKLSLKCKWKCKEYRIAKTVFFFLNLFTYLFLAVLGLRFCVRAFSSCCERGPLFIAVRGPITVAASPVAEPKLQTRRLSSCGSRA